MIEETQNLGDTMTIVTADLIFRGRSRRGAWSREQLKLIGVKWPPFRGWVNRAIGKEISDSNAALFLELTDKHLEKKNLCNKDRN